MGGIAALHCFAALAAPPIGPQVRLCFAAKITSGATTQPTHRPIVALSTIATQQQRAHLVVIDTELFSLRARDLLAHHGIHGATTNSSLPLGGLFSGLF